jgi:D-glycero-alpha-D-manno-heptose-7-phosphate kinase
MNGAQKLIITKTPLRMSYVGGGSDLTSYYREFGGAVISTALHLCFGKITI